MNDLKFDPALLKNNQSFCALPFVHLHVNEKNDVKLCCLADGQTIGKYTPDFDFVTNPELQKVRQAMLNGERVPHCQNCYNYEDGGADSSRLRDTQDWFINLGIKELEQMPVELVYYDIRNDNLCNLSCRMCNPQFSSQLAKEYSEIGWHWQTEPMSFGFTDVVDIKTVKKIYVAGGEPSLLPEFRKFLKLALDNNRTDIEIRMNTNATNFNKEYRSLLSNFTNLNIVCSIDGYDQVNKYIRWPADWTTLIENIHGLREITPHICFNVTVGIWNISNLSKLIFFFEKEFPGVYILLNQIMHPPSQMITAFADKEVAITDLELLKNSLSYKRDASFKSKVDFYISNIQSMPVDREALNEFFEFNDTLDQSRGIKLVDYIPALENCRKYLDE
jgi:sulfatase maturation enzyme AslB (radical SAM superfamily)